MSQNSNFSKHAQLAHSTRNPNLSIPQLNRRSENKVMQKFGSSWWTGIAPEQCVGFNKAKGSLQALPLLNLEICSRQDVQDYFDNTWTLTEVLFSSLKEESTYIRSPYHQLRHPLMFYYGHPAVLFLNKLRLAGLVENPVDLYLEKVLETGVDEMSWDDMSKNEMEWPTVSDVKDYRKKIYDIVAHIIKTHPDLDLEHRKKNNINLNWNHPLWALFMGIEHEKIHFETSSVLIRELPIDLVETPKYWPELFCKSEAILKNYENAQSNVKPIAGRSYPENAWVQVKGKTIEYGKDIQVPSYGWDNEYGVRKNKTSDFQVTKFLISNGEYYDFVASGAYQQDLYWEAEGQQWRKFRNTKRPTFWVAHGPEGLHDYKLRTIFEIIDMPWDWPVEVNYHEAKAYCNWKEEKDRKNKPSQNLKYRLITEAEFVTLRSDLESDSVLQKESYRTLETKKTEFNFNFSYASASPVNMHKSSHDVYDLFGNVWQWAEDQFNPLDNFKVHPLYDDFSTPCFDGKHQMILGGSFMSCGHEASVNARFHFRPHFFQHAGFRMSSTLDGSEDNGAIRLVQHKEYIHPTRDNILNQMQDANWWKK